VYGRENERAELESDSRWQARAVLLEDAQLVAGDVGERLPFRAVARWTDHNGLDHSGVVDVEGRKPAGAEVQVWVDAAGEAAPAPVRPVNAVAGGVAAGFEVLCAGGTLLVALWFGVRGLTARHNARHWARGVGAGGSGLAPPALTRRPAATGRRAPFNRAFSPCRSIAASGTLEEVEAEVMQLPRRSGARHGAATPGGAHGKVTDCPWWPGPHRHDPGVADPRWGAVGPRPPGPAIPARTRLALRPQPFTA
jgi:hypothetical protein